MDEKRTQIDGKDVRILSLLDKIGPKASTRQLSHVLKIPSRTVRYRLSKLRQDGFLQPFHALIHERRLGLGENIIAIQVRKQKEEAVRELCYTIPYLYWHSPTYGKYNGRLLHSVFSSTSPKTSSDLLQAMQDNGLISDFYTFDIVDYEVKNMNLTYFDAEHGWTWDWNKWTSEMDKNLRSSKKIVFSLNENPTVVDFDFKDVLILRRIMEDATVTLRELGGTLRLSQAQLSKRIRRLEKAGIIKGYKSVFNPIPIESLISFYCFLEFEGTSNRILACLKLLPYQMDILMESRKKFCIRLRLTARDLNGFLRGFDLLKPHLSSYFFQTVDPKTTGRLQQIYDLFDKETGRWETPTQEYVKKIKSLRH